MMLSREIAEIISIEEYVLTDEEAEAIASMHNHGSNSTLQLSLDPDIEPGYARTDTRLQRS